jgi:D-amino-acid dehydrogenase
MRVVVVGGGAVGLCCAHALRERGAEVVVVERERCGNGASAGNAGWITPAFAAPLAAPGVVRQALRWTLSRGGPFALRPRADLSLLAWGRAFLRSARADAYARGVRALVPLAADAVAAFERLRASGVEIELSGDGLLFAFRTEHALHDYVQTLRLLERTGYDSGFEVLAPQAARELEPALGPRVVGVINAPNERFLRPEALSKALVQWLDKRGVGLRENSTVTRLERRGEAWICESDVSLEADRVVVATGAWSAELLRPLGVRLLLEPAKGYSLTVPASDLRLGRALYLAEDKLAVTPFDGDVRIAGLLELAGVDLTLSRRRLDALSTAAARYLDGLGATPLKGSAWCGLRPLAPDGLPYIGAVEGHDGLYVATGHGMLGITLAPVTGELLAPLVLDGREDQRLSPFAPGRRML